MIPPPKHKAISTSKLGHSSRWRVQSKLLASPPAARLPGSSWRRRPLGSLLRRPAEWRSRTGSGLEQWPWGRSESTRRARSFWSESFRFSVWFVKSLRISKRIWGFRAVLFRRSRKLLRLTWWDSLKTPISVPFTLRGLLLCLRIFNSPEELEGKGLNFVIPFGFRVYVFLFSPFWFPSLNLSRFRFIVMMPFWLKYWNYAYSLQVNVNDLYGLCGWLVDCWLSWLCKLGGVVHSLLHDYFVSVR